MILPALKKTYQGQVVLDIPSTEIADGSIVAICGQNGSGKSTLAKILAGIEKPDIGTSFDLSASSENETSITKHYTVGYLPQQSYAFHMSVRSNILLNKDPKKTALENAAQAEAFLQKIGL
ncbi:MAG: ATP-binding cassette domain-containing protein, partial [Lachnospiraceae bacterium]|nr:ATP-binding cassette domain-containing protein [Lachnospiraceae bacterium]